MNFSGWDVNIKPVDNTRVVAILEPRVRENELNAFYNRRIAHAEIVERFEFKPVVFRHYLHRQQDTLFRCSIKNAVRFVLDMSFHMEYANGRVAKIKNAQVLFSVVAKIGISYFDFSIFNCISDSHFRFLNLGLQR